MATGLSRVIDRLRIPTFPQDGGGFTDGELLERFLTQRQEMAFAAVDLREANLHLPQIATVGRNGEFVLPIPAQMNADIH